MAKSYCSIKEAIENADITHQELNFTDEEVYINFANRLILRASRLIDRYCQRPDDFFNGGATITEIADAKDYYSTGLYAGTERADQHEIDRRTYQLSQTPIISVTNIHKNTAQVGASDNWIEIKTYRTNNVTGKIVIAWGATPSAGIMNMRFIYKAGYASIPDEIRWACEDLIANALKKRLQDALNVHVKFSRPASIVLNSPDVFTDEIKRTLEPYRKVNI